MTHTWKDWPVVVVLWSIVTWRDLRCPQPGHRYSDCFLLSLILIHLSTLVTWRDLRRPQPGHRYSDCFLGPAFLNLGLAVLIHLSTSSWSCAVLIYFLVLSSSALEPQMSHAWDALLFIQNFVLIFLANQIYSKISIVLFPPFVFFCVFSFLPDNSKAVVLLQIELVASDLSSHSESCDVFWGWCHF